MLLAELTIRHTRRTMATRRVMVAEHFLPTVGRAPGLVLATALAQECVPRLGDEQRDALAELVEAARSGLEIPQVAMRYRLQTDDHGLDRSRHRLFELGPDHVDDPAQRWVLELDVHGAPDPQVIGLVMAAATLEPTPRRVLLEAVLAVRRDVEAGTAQDRLPPDLVVRRLRDAPRRPRPGGPAGVPPFGETSREDAASERLDGYDAALSVEQRWAAHTLGITTGSGLERASVQRRFRVLLRQVHPDHGAARVGAAARISELREARAVLLDRLESQVVHPV